MKLSAVLAVRDEERMLEACLASLAFCDEVVVAVDDRTTDRTEEIARRHTPHVLVRPFEDYSQIRNEAIAVAQGEWILHVDADERITGPLASEIREAVDRDGPELAFRARTINFFWGRRMEHGGWADMWQVRLLKREQATYAGRVHEDVAIPPERIGTLQGERWHFSHRSIEENLSKAIQYGRLGALDRYERGAPKVKVRHLLGAMGHEFARRMVRRTGWRDGMPGVVEAFFQPVARMSELVMLWELQDAEDMQARYDALEREVASSHRAASSTSAAS
jgi:glycosyltransferase involved in cell wall biosynthesis